MKLSNAFVSGFLYKEGVSWIYEVDVNEFWELNGGTDQGALSGLELTLLEVLFISVVYQRKRWDPESRELSDLSKKKGQVIYIEIG